MEQHLQLTNSDGSMLDDPTIFQRLIGGLLYLTHTRTDIASCVQSLSQFMSAPRKLTYMVFMFTESSIYQGYPRARSPLPFFIFITTKRILIEGKS